MLRPTIRSLNHLLLLALLCALFEITPIQAKPSGQAPAASPQLLIPTWGAAPGGVWHYTASTNWVLKNSGLPSGKYWFWIAADPFNDQRWLMLGNSTSNGYGSQFFRIASGAVVMNDGVTAPLWVTENAGLTWNSLSLPGVGSLTTGIDMRRVEWSETVNGQWMVGWGIDSTARNGYEVLNRGSLGGAITTAVLFGPQRGTGFMSAFPGGNGEIVVHDRRGNGIDVSRIGYVLPGANAVAGNTSGPSITFWNNLERLPIPGASRALVGAASGADSGLWATSNYSSSALT